MCAGPADLCKVLDEIRYLQTPYQFQVSRFEAGIRCDPILLKRHFKAQCLLVPDHCKVLDEKQSDTIKVPSHFNYSLNELQKSGGGSDYKQAG
ncbi:hypothetical protein AVEN_85098-1 [Araneus ventricosus]|uniref:Uncharacterized protein n=1 Tax=Araneus ventricosus TaxID=182803 RepID=A0A4Y2SEC4_ARAVE|nr:hypothetical protein AVEN_85098-1 [Araneus ventricosus]